MKIPILHLEEGYHHFEDCIRKGSLHFYRDEIYPDDINIKVEVNKFAKNISCKTEISTRMHLTCDRCLAEFDEDFLEIFDILFHIGQDNLDIDEENVVTLLPDQKEIDLTSYIQETLILSIPMKILCRDDCKGICPNCGADLNKEECRCIDKPVDSRWENLKKLRK